MNNPTVTAVTDRDSSRHVTASVTVTNVTPPYRGVTVVTLANCRVKSGKQAVGLVTAADQTRRSKLHEKPTAFLSLFSANSEGMQDE